MFFAASKLLISLERPGEFLLLLLTVGVALLWLRRWCNTGRVLVTVALLALLSIWLLPIAGWVTAPLENRFPRPMLPARVDGLIVLGGVVDPEITARRGLPTFRGDPERMTEFVRLAKRYPDARLLFSGGAAASDVRGRFTEADVARLFFRQQGLDLSRFVFEDRSRDTFENVLFSKRLVQPKRGEVWLLVASARDVPRCMGIFRKLDWPVIPVPAGYRAEWQPWNFARNLSLLDDSMHEWLGLVAYRLAGRTDALFPAPRQR